MPTRTLFLAERAEHHASCCRIHATSFSEHYEPGIGKNRCSGSSGPTEETAIDIAQRCSPLASFQKANTLNSQKHLDCCSRGQHPHTGADCVQRSGFTTSFAKCRNCAVILLDCDRRDRNRLHLPGRTGCRI